MNRLLSIVLTVALSLCLLAGCAVDPTAKPWWTIREADFQQLQPGKTTKTEVRAAFGRPLREMTFPRLGEEVWDYRHLDVVMHMVASVYFDAQGAYKYYTTQPDWAEYSPGGM
jgi:outer membrane protein assembly factor BamE (lipoprotein component of BamABCDE complex)